MQMIDVLKRLAELDAQNPNVINNSQTTVAESDALEGSTRYGAWDPDYGSYRGEPGDPRTPEVSDDEESYEVNKEWLNVLQNADDPVNIDELPNADLIDHIKHEAQSHNVDLNDQSQVDHLIGKIVDELEDGIKSWEDFVSSSDEPDDSRYDVFEGLTECGDGMMGYNQPKTPASINMTAGSGEELSAMLKDIMSLAGLKQVGPGDMEQDHEPTVVSTPPTISIASMDDEPEFMRSMIDKLNEPGEDDKVVKELDNAPDEEILDARSGPLGLNGLASSDQSGPPGGGDGRKVVTPRAHVETTYESLISEYKKFISEDQDADRNVDEGSAHGYNVVKWYKKWGDQIKLTKWLRKEAGLPKDAPVYFDDADLVYGDETIVPNALGNPNLTLNDLLTAVAQAAGGKAKQKMDGVYREGMAEGMKGAMVGGIAGGVLTKNVQGALAGAEIGDHIQDMFSDDENASESTVNEIGDTEKGRAALQRYANAAKKDYNQTNVWGKEEGMGTYRTRKKTAPDHWSTRDQGNRLKGLAQAKNRGITPEKPSSGKHVSAGDRLRSDSRGSMGSGIKREGFGDQSKYVNTTQGFPGDPTKVAAAKKTTPSNPPAPVTRNAMSLPKPKK